MNIKNHFFAGTVLSGPIVPSFDTGNGEGSGGDSGAPAPDSQGGVKEPTTMEKLEMEFDNSEAPADDDGGDSDDGSESDDDGEESEEGEDEGGEDDDTGEESESEEEEASSGEKSAEPSENEKELTARAEAAEAELTRVRDAAEKAGVVLGDAAEEVTIPEEPDPSKYNFGEHDLDYIKDKAAYDAKMELIQENAQARFKVEAAALEAKWTKNLAEHSSKYSDFDEVVVKGAADKKWQCPPVVAVAIKDSDYGVDIAYEMAKDPAEAARISKLSPLEQARAFGRMEERQHVKAEEAKRKAEKAAEREAQENQPRRITKAPVPPKRQVRGSGGTGIRNLAELASSDDFNSFDKAVDAKRKVRA